VLFDCSIRENISYGVSCSDVPFDAIVEAAKKANAHNFIMSLPQVYKKTFPEINVFEIIVGFTKIKFLGLRHDSRG